MAEALGPGGWLLLRESIVAMNLDQPEHAKAWQVWAWHLARRCGADRIFAWNVHIWSWHCLRPKPRLTSQKQQ